MSTAATINVPRSAVLFDSATQLRVEINNAIVAEYAEALAAGESFPPVVLFADQVGPGAKYFIGDGWHRMLAYEGNGDVTVPAIVHVGGLERAIKYALSANARHGLKRSNADKQKAVRVALERFGELSDRAVAELCAVHHSTVADYRKRQVADSATSTANATRKGRDDKSYPAGKPVVAKPAVVVPMSTINPNLTLADEQRILAIPDAMVDYGARMMCRALGVEDATNTDKTDEQLAAAARAVLDAEKAAGVVVVTEVEVMADRQPILKPSQAGAPFDSGTWKVEMREALRVRLDRVPDKHKQAAAEYVALQAKQLVETT